MTGPCSVSHTYNVGTISGSRLLRARHQILHTRSRRRLLPAVEILGVAVDVINRVLPHLERVRHANVGGHVPGEANTDFLRLAVPIASLGASDKPEMSV